MQILPPPFRKRIKYWLNKPIEEKTRGIAYRFDKMADFFFETRYGLDFTGRILPDELSIEDLESIRHAKAYLAVRTTSIRMLINEAVKTRDFENFIDIGSGKGKACLYAARTGLFKQIVGVEISKPLIEIARINSRKCGFANVINLIHANAASFTFPPGRNLVFMFNPMDGKLLRQVLKNNLGSFRESGSVIAYAVDEHKEVILDLGFDTIYRDQNFLLSLYEHVR